MKKCIFIYLIMTFVALSITPSKSQCSCCSAAFSGSALAAGTSNIGVLKEGSFRIIGIYRYVDGTRFFRESEQLKKYDDENLSVHFTGINLGYGVTKEFTVDLELGAFPDKDLNFGYTRDQISGFSSATVVGKFTIFADRETSQELTVGAGYKQPLTSNTTLSGNSGAVFQLFYFKNITDDLNLVLFNRSELYFEDSQNYIQGNSIISSLFITKGITDKLTAILENRYEYQQSSIQDNVDLINTGRQIFTLVPQFSYNFSDFSLSAFFEIPVYRNYTGVQLGDRFGTGLAIVYMF